MRLAELQLEGAGAEQSLEVMSTDIGADEAGPDRALNGHYPVGVLLIGPALSMVRTVDAPDKLIPIGTSFFADSTRTAESMALTSTPSSPSGRREAVESEPQTADRP